MLHTPLWKRLIVIALVAWGILASAPNLFYRQVEAHNDAAAAIAKAAQGLPPRALPVPEPLTRLAGLEPFILAA